MHKIKGSGLKDPQVACTGNPTHVTACVTWKLVGGSAAFPLECGLVFKQQNSKCLKSLGPGSPGTREVGSPSSPARRFQAFFGLTENNSLF